MDLQVATRDLVEIGIFQPKSQILKLLANSINFPFDKRPYITYSLLLQFFKTPESSRLNKFKLKMLTSEPTYILIFLKNDALKEVVHPNFIFSWNKELSSLI